jgi:hypothetical protein
MGGYATIRNYVLPFCGVRAALSAVPGPPKARDLSRWITADPDHLDNDAKAKLAEAREQCPHLDALAATSPSSPRSSPDTTATASMPGSPQSRPPS